MMHYEAALRLQAQLERVEHMEVDEVLRLKFSYVVAAQVYGKMKKSQDSKAEDIEWLLHRYPNLRVAYIDEKPFDRRGGAHFFSCLIKSEKKENQGGEEKKQEREGGGVAFCIHSAFQL
jgi:callose synthase